MSFLKTLIAGVWMVSFSGLAQSATSLTWYGQSGYQIKTPQGHVILIDPWLTNPKNPQGQAQLAALSQVDLILLTHGHADHLGNTIEIAQKTGAKLVTTFDLGKILVEQKGFPKEQFGFTTTGNIGGLIQLLNGDVSVGFVPAVHSSSIAHEDEKGQTTWYGGTQNGFYVQIKNGPSFYHTGDTDVFGDMQLINLFGPVDIMLTAIGDTFTMGPKRAAHATKLVNPRRTVIPNHYGTFGILTGTPQAFAKELKAQGVKTPLTVMEIGQTLHF
jgi:L-ascorbate metabolism protein UlaG (beta-lactamase superfamily)